MQAFACCVAAHPLAVSSICVAPRRSDIKLPSEMNPSPPGADELSATIRKLLEEEKDFYVIVQSACGKEQIMDTKVMTG